MNARFRSRCLTAVALATACAWSPLPLRAEGTAAAAQPTFASSDEAVQALRSAAASPDRAAVAALFGPEYADMQTGDAAQDAADFKRFSRAVAEKLAPVKKSDDEIVLEIGANGWPFPIPLVKENDRWFFDTDAGKKEIVNRHVGKGELDAIGLCRAYAKGLVRRSRLVRSKPLHGYFFKTVDAAGGGSVLIAYPESWDRSGVLTFAVGSDGVVYRRDLGEKTGEIAAAMKRYDGGADWAVEKDSGTWIETPGAAKTQ
jgi:hypothetical protein